MKIDPSTTQSPTQAETITSLQSLDKTLEAKKKVLEAIAVALGARPIGGSTSISGGNHPEGLGEQVGGAELEGFDSEAGDDALLERTTAIADLDIRGLGFSDAASVLALARDAAPASHPLTAHDSAILGATLAAQNALSGQATSGSNATDHLAVLTDYYAQHA